MGLNNPAACKPSRRRQLFFQKTCTTLAGTKKNGDTPGGAATPGASLWFTKKNGAGQSGASYNFFADAM